MMDNLAKAFDWDVAARDRDQKLAAEERRDRGDGIREAWSTSATA